MTRNVAILLSVIALWTMPSGALASVVPADTGTWWLMPGGSAAVTLPATTGAETLGGELSLVCHNCGQQHWLGVYADVVGDIGRDQVRISVGPEYGVDGMGLDGGPVIAFDSGEARGGVVVRGMLTIAALGLYVRLGQLFINGSQTYAELGAYFKVPIAIAPYSDRKRPQHPHAR